MNDDTAEIEANVDNAYQTGIRDGRKLERERIAAAILDQCDDLAVQPCRACRHAATIARTEPS